MIDKISLVTSESNGKVKHELIPGPLTLFVGPNNSGKSMLLRELYLMCDQLHGHPLDLVADVTFSSVPDEEFNMLKRNRLHEQQPASHYMYWETKSGKHTVDPDHLKSLFEMPNNFKQRFIELYAREHTLLLDGQKRLEILASHASTGYRDKSIKKQILTEIMTNEHKRQDIRHILYSAFKKYAVIDPTQLRTLSFSFSNRSPANSNEEIGINEDAIRYHENNLHIQYYSDGVKAFSGIIASVIAGDHKALLIDEPEAFLHPTLAFNLGKHIGRLSKEYQKQFFISTHSSDLVMGCIQSGVAVQVIRLTYDGINSTLRKLNPERLVTLMRNPLLRSANIIRGIFYDSVIVTESDTDRAFYQEINERLNSSNDNRGIHNCLFVNAQNKQTEKEIIGLLRELGVATAGIVDIDIIKEGGTSWMNLLKGLNVPEIIAQSLSQTRAAVAKIFEQHTDMKRNGGIELLSGNDKKACQHLFDQLKEYGLFVVARGELEHWLQHFGIAGKGPAWLIKMFERMGEDPRISNYVMPDTGDVWDFIGEIRKWTQNANRKGLNS